LDEDYFSNETRKHITIITTVTMRIMIYTQAQRVGGGSSTLLINLAKHLTRRHAVTFAFRDAAQKDDYNSVARFEHDSVIVTDLLSRNASVRPDVMVCHFPRSLDPMAFLQGVRKVAVIMEVPGSDRTLIDSDSHTLFDDIIFLNDAQIAGIPGAGSGGKYHRLGIIDDIDFTPAYGKTRDVGCIKNEFSTLHQVISQSPETGWFKVYYAHSRIVRVMADALCSAHSYVSSTRLLRPIGWAARGFFGRCSRRLAGGTLKKALQFAASCHRMKVMGFERSVERLFGSFDCLLRTPHHSIGASLAVQDALACGKPVVLSDIPGHRTAYSRFKGVHFANEIDYCLDGLMGSYDRGVFREIRDSYLAVYDREATLAQWEAIITA
jgi:hypothetical protein